MNYFTARKLMRTLQLVCLEYPKYLLLLIVCVGLSINPLQAQDYWRFSNVQLVASYPQQVNLSIRLRTGGGSNGDSTPGTTLLGYWQQHIHGKPEASERTKHLIRDWYKLKDLEEFSSQYPLDVNKGNNNGNLKQLEDLHVQWMEREEISATPTFFVNGYQLPRAYRIDDLMGIVPGLVDHVKQLDMKRKTFMKEEELASSRISSSLGRSNKG